jgi:predicted small metal-binding protein
MATVEHCRELGFLCDGVVRAETEAPALQPVAGHARTVHRMDAVPEERVQPVRAVM